MAAAEGVPATLWSQVHQRTTQPRYALHFNKKPSSC